MPLDIAVFPDPARLHERKLRAILSIKSAIDNVLKILLGPHPFDVCSAIR
jgi:hypothetical protein